MAPVIAPAGIVTQAANCNDHNPTFLKRLGRRVIWRLCTLEGISHDASSTRMCLLTSRYRVVAGIGVGMASVAVPLYISENAPRAIRGALTGLYQLSIVLGIMASFWIDYASLLHISGNATWIVPISLQALPVVLLFFGMLLCNETPRHWRSRIPWPR